MDKKRVFSFLLAGLLTSSVLLLSCKKDKAQDPPVQPSTAIEVTYSVPQVNAIIATKITYTDGDNKPIVVENATMPWTKKIQANAPFTATLKIENSLIPNIEIPDMITLGSGYTISCSGALEDTQAFSSSMTIKKEQLDKWLTRPAKEYSHTFTIEDKQ